MELSRADFKKCVLSEKKTALIEFWAPWCSHCRRLAPTFDAIATQYYSLLVAKINIDDEPSLAKDYKIDMIPTLVLFRGGKAVAGLLAPDSKASIDSFLQDNLNKKA